MKKKSDVTSKSFWTQFFITFIGATALSALMNEIEGMSSLIALFISCFLCTWIFRKIRGENGHGN